MSHHHSLAPPIPLTQLTLFHSLLPNYLALINLSLNLIPPRPTISPYSSILPNTLIPFSCPIALPYSLNPLFLRPALPLHFLAIGQLPSNFLTQLIPPLAFLTLLYHILSPIHIHQLSHFTIPFSTISFPLVTVSYSKSNSLSPKLLATLGCITNIILSQHTLALLSHRTCSPNLRNTTLQTHSSLVLFFRSTHSTYSLTQLTFSIY